MKKKNADDFIEANHEAFGLNGSNVVHNPQLYSEIEGDNIRIYSKDNHFKWGYNGEFFNTRHSSSSMYFTDYGKLPYTGTTLPVDLMLVHIIEELKKYYFSDEKISVINRGRYEDYAFVHACQEARVDFNEISIEYEDDENASGNITLDEETNTLKITRESLLLTAAMINGWSRIKSLKVIQDILIYRKAGGNLVFPSRLHFVNHNYDIDRACGPRYWSLADAEQDTTLMRYHWLNGETNLSADRKLALTNLGIWSPELIHSQLCEPIMKQCFMSDNKDSEMATDLMWQSCCPAHVEPLKLPDWWDETEKLIGTYHDGSKFNEVWYTPLHRLAQHYELPYVDEQTERTYGSVF